jgi:arylesterase/paraoxonase
MMRRISLAAALIVALIAGYVVFGLLVPGGVFKTIKPHFEGDILKIEVPVAGPEDITIDMHTGLAFISADDRRTNMKSPGAVEGAIFLLDLNDSITSMRNITPSGLDDFHPHGISLWRESDGRLFLLAINHRQKNGAHVVERFEWRNDSLVYLETIADPLLMTSPNDLVAVGERSFYVTNDHYYTERGKLSRTMEDYLQRSIAYVNYYDGVTFRKVAEGIAYPNGIAVSPDQSRIFVASSTGRKVLIYNRDKTSGALQLHKAMNVGTGPDNIETDESGSLWIACHPQLLNFAAHAKDPARFSPSQVIRLVPAGPNDYLMEEIFLNDGTSYSGSSVAAVYKNKMLIGSVFENYVLLCTLNPQ